MDPFLARQEPPIKMNYASAQEHVPRAERNNRVIQEQVRAAYHRFPFTYLPRILVKFLVMESTKKLICFPNKYGVSKYFSPRVIMHQENLEYEQHWKYQIGEYVQAHEEPKHTNTNAPRSLDCIYLQQPMDNAQGGHELLHLQTNKVVKRRTLTKIPITPSIIKQVHALVELDEMPAGLKITNRANRVIFDSAWIAGVDYDEDLFDDDHHNEEEDGDDNDDNDNNEEDEEDYDKMDEKQLGRHPTTQPNEFQVPHETEEPENEHEIVFKEGSNAEELQEEEGLFEDDEDEEYEPGNEEDISLEADDDDGEEEDDQGKRRTGRVRVPPQSWQHLQARDEHTEEYSSDSAQIIAITMVHYNTTLLAGMNDVQASKQAAFYKLTA
jgi:hypothetical protein